MSYYRRYASGSFDNGPESVCAEAITPPVPPLSVTPHAEQTTVSFPEESPIYWNEEPRFRTLGDTAVMNADIWYDVTGHDPGWMSGE